MKNDFKEVQPVETDDRLQADDIYGIYGSPQRQYAKTLEKDETVLPREACKQAMWTPYISGKYRDLSESLVTYDRNKLIARRILRAKKGERLGAGPFHLLSCPVIDRATGKNFRFLLLRGPQNGLCYVIGEERMYRSGTLWFFKAVIKLQQ